MLKNQNILKEFHKRTITIKVIMGDKRKIVLLEREGTILYFNNSLTPSKRGCVSPHKALLLGPNRFCLNPRIFRSSSVINITPINRRIKNSK